MYKRVVAFCCVLVVCSLLAFPASAVSFDDVQNEQNIIRDLDLSVGYSSQFSNVPFVTDRYLIIRANNVLYLLDVPDLSSIDISLYNSHIYTTGTVSMLACNTSGTPCYIRFSTGSTTCSIRNFDSNNYESDVSYSVVPAVYTYGANNELSYDLYSEMGFVPDTEFDIQTVEVEETYFTVYLYIIIFLLMALVVIFLIRGGKRT